MKRPSRAVYRITFIAMCVAFFTLCSWLAIPFIINITFQIFAVFLVASITKPLISFLSVISYISLGLIGAPVFSGFGSGISALAGASGGFIIGFVLASLIISLFSHCYYEKKYLHLLLMLISLIVCYLFGVLWYMFVFNYSVNVPFVDCMLICVLPFVIPDILKILLVWIAFQRLFPYMKRLNEKI